MDDKTDKKASPSGDKSTSLGLSENVEALLAYFFGLIGGLVFYFLEKKNKFVRFHGMQSILLILGASVVLVGLSIISMVLALIPGIGVIISLLVGFVTLLFALAVFVGWLYTMYKAYKHEMYKLPIIGNMAEKYAK